jgi:hypothetical protein
LEIAEKNRLRGGALLQLRSFTSPVETPPRNHYLLDAHYLWNSVLNR